jgi:hypothetical protein
MQNESVETLPKMLSGVVCSQWVRCGRPNCRCTRGQLHGPYYYRFWRQHGRLRKAYVKQSELDHVRTACEERRRNRRAVVDAWREWRTIQSFLREVEQA